MYGIWSSKRTMMAITALTAAALFGFVIAGDAIVHNRALLYALLIVPIWGISSVVAVLSVYSAEIYPTRIRSRGTGFGSGSGSGTVEQNEVKGQSGNLAFLDKVYDGIRLEARLTGTEAAQKQTVEVMSLEALVAGSIFDVVEQLPLGLATGVEAVGECSITNGAGIRRSARSVRPRTNGARAKRAWTPWKTAKDAVSHRAHTRPCPLKKTREDRLKQRSQPVHQIGSRSMEPSRVAGEPSFWTSRARNSSDRRPCTAFRISAQR